MKARFIASAVGVTAVALTATTALGAGNSSNPAGNTVVEATTISRAHTAPAAHLAASRVSTNVPGLQAPSFPQRSLQPKAADNSEKGQSSSWTEGELYSTHQPVFVGPLGGKLVVVDGKPNLKDSRLYDLTISAVDTPIETLSIYSGGLMTERIHQELITVSQQVVDLTLSVKYHYDKSQPVCIAGISGTCLARLPLDPGNSTWTTQRSSQADLTISVKVDANGTKQAQTLSIPIVGQVFALVP
jgi:hypothetical protein